MAEPPRGRARLPRAARLRARDEFEALFRNGARLERASFVVLWRGGPGRRAVAVVAGRRLGGSVIRNRARRRLREAFRQQQDLLPDAGVRLCLVARRGALEIPWPRLVAEVGEALRGVRRRLGGSAADRPS